MDWLFEWLQAFTAWLYGLFKDVFTALWDFVKDAILWAFDGLLTGILAVVTAIPVPSFLSGYSLATLFSVFPPEVLFFVGKLRMGESLALLGAGVSFRLLRKLTTVGQW